MRGDSFNHEVYLHPHCLGSSLRMSQPRFKEKLEASIVNPDGAEGDVAKRRGGKDKQEILRLESMN